MAARLRDENANVRRGYAQAIDAIMKHKTNGSLPVGVALGPDGSLLVADDVGDVIWRVTGEGRV